jgi:hypothetical protein
LAAAGSDWEFVVFRSVILIAGILATFAVVDAKPVIKTYDPGAKQPLTPLQQRYAPAASPRRIVVAQAQVPGSTTPSAPVALLSIASPAVPMPVMRELPALDSAAADSPAALPAVEVKTVQAAQAEIAAIASTATPTDVDQAAPADVVDSATVAGPVPASGQLGPIALLPAAPVEPVAAAEFSPASQSDLAAALTARAASVATAVQTIAGVSNAHMEDRVNRIEADLSIYVAILAFIAGLQFIALVWLGTRVRKAQVALGWLG